VAASVRRTCLALAAVASLASLGCAVTSTAGAAKASLKAAEIIPVTGGGKVPQFDGIQGPMECPAGFYVQRGANQTVAKKKVLVEPPVIFGPVIAKDTVPNEFGSRAVTSLDFFVSNPWFGDGEWHVTFYCTNDKSDAWLVFG
jgi:hypothetical protein